MDKHNQYMSIKQTKLIVNTHKQNPKFILQQWAFLLSNNMETRENLTKSKREGGREREREGGKRERERLMLLYPLTAFKLFFKGSKDLLSRQ